MTMVLPAVVFCEVLPGSSVMSLNDETELFLKRLKKRKSMLKSRLLHRRLSSTVRELLLSEATC